MKLPTGLNFLKQCVVIDGVEISYTTIAEALYIIAHPDPRKWYRLERTGNTISIHVKISEEGANGQPIGIIGDAVGRSEEGTGRQG